MLVTVILLAKEKVINMLAMEFFLSKKNVFSSMLANIVGLCFVYTIKKYRYMNNKFHSKTDCVLSDYIHCF